MTHPAFDVGDRVWVRPADYPDQRPRSTTWRHGEVIRASRQPDDYLVQITEGAGVGDATWFYETELRPRSAVELLGELVT